MEGREVDGLEDGGGIMGKKREEAVDVESNAALEGQKAGEAVFRAIFGDESDDDDE